MGVEAFQVVSAIIAEAFAVCMNQQWLKRVGAVQVTIWNDTRTRVKPRGIANESLFESYAVFARDCDVAIGTVAIRHGIL